MRARSAGWPRPTSATSTPRAWSTRCSSPTRRRPSDSQRSTLRDPERSLPGPVRHRLDVVPVGVVDVRRVVRLVVVGPETGRPVVLSSGRDCLLVEPVDARAVGCAERDVCRASLRARADPEIRYSLAGAEAGCSLELHLERIAERRERLPVEALGSFEVADVRGDVI